MSYTESESEEDSDYDEDDEVIQEYDVITTEGSVVLQNYDPSLEVTQCELCAKYYPISVFIMTFPLQCKHCFFFINYNNSSMINGSNGITVPQYIEECSAKHISPCEKLSGGSCECYLCANYFGLPLDGVITKKKELKCQNDSECSIDNVENVENLSDSNEENFVLYI